MKNNKTGFTLVEIMLVMAIVSLLATVAIVEGVQLKKQANEANAQANLKAIASGFEIYAARHGGTYAPGEQAGLQFLVDADCLYQDLVGLGQVGNFRYIVGSAGAAGYDIRAMAINPALAAHNYQIVTGDILKRSDTSSPGDEDFKIFR
jgi:prepilin-type N-terminal cleavage/methylation domain-containing protein